jgi:hypothetical protein
VRRVWRDQGVWGNGVERVVKGDGDVERVRVGMKLVRRVRKMESRGRIGEE